MPATRFLPAALAAGALALLQPAGASAAGAQKVEVFDVGGFAEPVLAATLEIPADWRAQGAVGWNRATQCVTNVVRFEWRARSRDDLQGFEVMPGYTWQVRGTQIPTNPCPVQPLRSAREFLEAVVQARRAGARILQYRDRPDFAAEATAQARADPRVRTRIESGELLVAYRSDGVEFREVFGTTVTFTEVQGNAVGGTPLVFAHRARHGSLDFDLGERMVRSLRVDPKWAQRMQATLSDAEQRRASAQSRAIAQWHEREMARITAQGEADRAAIRAATARDVARINAQPHANTQATNDRMHRRTLEGIGEYDTYAGDNGTAVRSSIHGGRRVLSGGNGTYFSTDDPYFNPAGSRELQRVR